MNVKKPIIASESSAPLATYSQTVRSGDMIKEIVEDHTRES